ncbi:16S rRNA (guanine(527)-N(7))-methyltransferase RsmG [Desulfosporosinus metallidurans]|uniref:Ribosomal RNA small subunit methyltransferase G n=1 Tax=Desulfosporosinus metallidurans TaxID=1888891 RepID=A0A1Q8R328_9FIRM|nr:16S rRNA (guanine(527)-N(7))-methyltransferase RsmG [Desulfosporosinus metallidurans]OLN34025.1 rRNA small subunit 7-methylguanosine (m7G) methyltransferase GidB [Desulfosporosinus metallidurans]
MFHEHASVIQDLTFKHTGCVLTESQNAQFCLYGDLLQEWNQRMNLTRITEPHEVILKHFIDSMILTRFLSGSCFADLGTGAGFPGVPLKILRPELDVILMDSLKKRLGFLDIVIDRLNLTGIMTVHARTEDFGKDPLYRGHFDTVSSRAVARLPVLLEYALPVLKINGLFLAPKGSQTDNELAESQKALKVLGGEVEGIERYSLGEGAEYRAVVLIRKVKQTPLQYPRQPGVPVKNPLI